MLWHICLGIEESVKGSFFYWYIRKHKRIDTDHIMAQKQVEEMQENEEEATLPSSKANQKCKLKLLYLGVVICLWTKAIHCFYFCLNF